MNFIRVGPGSKVPNPLACARSRDAASPYVIPMIVEFVK
jgi:hypothetical protein